MGIACRDRSLRHCAVASCAVLAAWMTVAGCSFPDVSIGNSSNARVGDSSVQSSNGGSAAGSSSSGTGGGAGDAGQAPGIEGDAPDGVDATIAEGSSSGASRSGSSGSGSSGAGGSGTSGSNGSSGSSSGAGSGSSGSWGSSGSGSGTGSSSGGPGPCTCGPGQTLAYPTNISCGTVLQVLGVSVCSGPAKGFSDNGPPCGQVGTLTTCSVVGLNLNAACVRGIGSAATQTCQ